MNDITGQKLDENECLWEWDCLKRKGLILSRTKLVFRPCIETLLYLNDKKKRIKKERKFYIFIKNKKQHSSSYTFACNLLCQRVHEELKLRVGNILSICIGFLRICI